MAAIAPFAPLTSGAVAPILVFDFVAWLNFSALVNFGGFGNLGGLGIFADAAIAAKGVDTGGAASFAFFFDVTFGIGLVAGLGLAGLAGLVDFGIGLVSFVALASLATLASFLDTAVLALAFALVAAFDFTFVAGLLVFVVFSTFAAFFAITAFVVLGFLAVATAAFAVLTTGLAFSVGFALPFVTTFLMALLDAREDFFDVGKGFFATTFLATGFLETTFLTASFLAANFLGVAFADLVDLVDLVDLAGLLDFIEPTVFATTFDFLIEAMMFSLRARNIFVLLDQKNANCRSARSEPK